MNIDNIELVTDIYGRFPSFHDAEVHRIVLCQNGRDRLPTLEVSIHVFEMTDEVDDDQSFVLRHHNMVTICFSEIDKLKLDGFNHQNVLAGISIKELAQGSIEVIMEAIFGVDVRFKCTTIKILSVEPIGQLD